MIAFIAAFAAGGAVLLLAPVLVSLDEPTASSAARSPERRDERALLVRLRPLLCGLAVVAGWVVFGGTVGLVLGAAGAAVSWRALEHLESPATVRRRQELERDLPAAVQLLGACLVAGSAMTTALASVAGAMPGAVGDELELLRRRLQWATDPASVWRSVDGPLEALGRTMARAHESGASVQHAVARLAGDLRGAARARADARARTIEVRAAAPLGLCFLPAFVLLGVVPMAAGLFASLSFFG